MKIVSVRPWIIVASLAACTKTPVPETPATPTVAPTEVATIVPSEVPTVVVTERATKRPTAKPSDPIPDFPPEPTMGPMDPWPDTPTKKPTSKPTVRPTVKPTVPPTVPTVKPTAIPPVPTTPPKQPVKWAPVPAEDQANGENDNAYYAAIGHPTSQEEQAYVAEISAYAKKWAVPAGIPPSVVVAMACNESGFGYTRVGYNSNSIFSQKNWDCKWSSRYSNSCYALIGQPDEYDGNIRIIKQTARGVIYDESNRPDNKYFGYPSREVAVQALVQEWIVEGNYPPEQKGKYAQTIKSYKANLAKGMSKYDAAIYFIRQLADLGYMHLGGQVYVDNLKPILDKFQLVQKLD